jgi:MFS transporter, DHA2 family, methylenomycin A resistance protein
MSLGYGVVQLDVTIVNTALSSIGSSLGGGVSELQWVVSSYTIAFAALILTAGTLGDRLGAKKIFMLGFALFTVASLACACVQSAAGLIAARAVQGVGAALLVPNSLALLNHAYREEKARGRAVGIWAAGASAALTAGPLAGGALIMLVGWRSIFLVNLPIGLSGLWMTWRFSAETMPAISRRLDLLGQAAAVGALGCLAGAIIEGGALGWAHASVLGGFGAFIVLAALFLWRERSARQPMLPLSLFAHRMFALTSMVGLLVNVSFYGLIFVFGLYFQQVRHLSPMATGFALVPMMGGVLAMNLLAARQTERLGARVIIAAGAVLGGVGCALLITIGSGISYWMICVPLLVIGAGLGLLVPPLTSALLASVEKARSGIAAAVLNATRQTGSVLGVALFGSLIARANAFIPGARESLIISAALLIGAAIAIVVGGGKKTVR